MHIDATSVAAGTYDIVLQSYDLSSGGVNSTLMSDTVILTVEAGSGATETTEASIEPAETTEDDSGGVQITEYPGCPVTQADFDAFAR